jgi:hypothetical protein
VTTINQDMDGVFFIDPPRNAALFAELAKRKPVLWVPLDTEKRLYELLDALVEDNGTAWEIREKLMDKQVRSICTLLVSEVTCIDKNYPLSTFWKWLASLVILEEEYKSFYKSIIRTVDMFMEVTNPNYTLERFAREEVFRNGLARAKGFKMPHYERYLLDRARALLTTAIILA